jgi:hypothetical protein
MRRDKLAIPEVGTIVVWSIDRDDELRLVFGYGIRDGRGDLLEQGRDLRGGVMASPSAREMTGVLLGFLDAAPDGFTPQTEEWARQHHTELGLARWELEEGVRR